MIKFWPTSNSPNNAKECLVAHQKGGNKIMKVKDLTVKKKKHAYSWFNESILVYRMGMNHSPYALIKSYFMPIGWTHSDKMRFLKKTVRNLTHYWQCHSEYQEKQNHSVFFMPTFSIYQKKKKKTMHQNGMSQADETSEKNLSQPEWSINTLVK